MNLRIGIAVLVVAGAAWAQSAQPVASAPASDATEVSIAPKSSAPSKRAHAKKHASAPVVAVEEQNSSAQAQEPEPGVKKMNLTSRRDPFVSPVVNRSAIGGSGCSTGKRCLAIDQIALKGVVRSDAGMIAVVTNAMEKAYFLHENDPVFNGYVVKITGDSIVFKETVQDKVGKPMTREVTKKITTPAV